MVQLYWADEGGLPAGDRGLAYGDGLFETIRVDAGRAPLLSYHLDRMTRDAKRLGIAVSRDELEAISRRALSRYSESGQPWVLKLILTRGSGGRGYRPGPDMQSNVLVSRSAVPPAAPVEGVVLAFSRVTLTVNPLLAGIKSLNRLEQVMAAQELTEGLFEVLMSNAEGHIVEGTRTNLFVATPEGWLTPPAQTVAVSGVMRRFVVERLRAVGEQVREAPVLPEHLRGENCQGVYLTNSVLGIVAVRALAGQDLPVNNRLATICGSPSTLE